MDRKYNTIIESIGIYLPPNVVSTEEVMQGCKVPIYFPLEQLTGIRFRRVVSKGEYSIDLAKKAVVDCFANSQYSPAEIDLLICCNISRVDFPEAVSYEPNTSIKIRKAFGFDNAHAFDIANACAGIFTAIYVAESYIKAGLVRRAMVISGEYITHLTETAQKEIKGAFDLR